MCSNCRDLKCFLALILSKNTAIFFSFFSPLSIIFLGILFLVIALLYVGLFSETMLRTFLGHCLKGSFLSHLQGDKMSRGTNCSSNKVSLWTHWDRLILTSRDWNITTNVCCQAVENWIEKLPNIVHLNVFWNLFR